MNVNLQYLDFQIPVFFDWPEGVRFKIVTKGRRTGITRGGANSFIEILLEGDGPILWGDTINSNIEKYWQRYFLPELTANKIPYHWSEQKKTLTINNQYMDFRSADNPENWEGFGYKYIFLNEAGIILKDKNLYVNTVLPMLLDFPDSKLIAAGVPKGKKLKDGKPHPFYTLALKADSGDPKYQRIELSSYDNPLLTPEDIRSIEEEITAIGSGSDVEQEIYGKFIDSIPGSLFAVNFDKAYHVSNDAIFNPSRRIILSIDFNMQPFAGTLSHLWEDTSGIHDHTFDEIEIDHGSVPAMADEIKLRYGGHLHKVEITGDYMGNRGDMSQRDLSSLYRQLCKLLGIPFQNLKLHPNPTHINSKADFNFFLWKAKQEGSKIFYKVHPNCKNTIFDLQSVQWDSLKSEIVKRNRKDETQRGDFIDTQRYKCQAYWRPIINRFR